MSNLGGYQRMTTVAKAVGGPGSAVALVLGAGVVIGGALVAGGSRFVRTVKRGAHEATTKPPAAKGRVYEATRSGADDAGFVIHAGDRFRVLESDGDAILVELLGDPHNPYFVSAAFLRTISDFPSEHDGTDS